MTMPKEWTCFNWTLSEEWCTPGDPHVECAVPNGYSTMTDYDLTEEIEEYVLHEMMMEGMRRDYEPMIKCGTIPASSGSPDYTALTPRS